MHRGPDRPAPAALGALGALAGLALLCVPLGSLAAQLAPLTVPRGAVRVELAASLESWDRRFALVDAEGGVHPIGVDAQVGRMEGAIGLAIGLPLRATLLGYFPLVRAEARSAELVAPDADPATTEPIEDYAVTSGGDSELGLAFSLVDRWNYAETRGLRLAVEGRVRLPTGRRGSALALVPVGTGDRLTDLEGTVALDVGGGRAGARLVGTYVRQQPGTVIARSDDPTAPAEDASQLARVRLDPGDVLRLGVRPFVRIAPNFGVQLGLDWERRQGDRYPELAVADGADTSRWLLSAGLAYADLGGLVPGGRGLPIDAELRWYHTVRQDAGYDPGGVAMRVRVYGRLFR